MYRDLIVMHASRNRLVASHNTNAANSCKVGSYTVREIGVCFECNWRGGIIKEQRHVEAQRLRGLKIDRQLELDRGLDGKFARASRPSMYQTVTRRGQQVRSAFVFP